MSLTRAQAETELVSRQKARMQIVEMAVTVVGTNTDLQSPMAFALRKMGYTASIPVSDSDLAGLSSEELDKFYDLAELRLMNNIKGSLVLVDIKVGPRSKNLSQISDALQKDIEALQSKIDKEYGSLDVGVVDFDFQETTEE